MEQVLACRDRGCAATGVGPDTTDIDIAVIDPATFGKPLADQLASQVVLLHQHQATPTDARVTAATSSRRDTRYLEPPARGETSS